jgi:hypothetical protein
MNLDPVFCCQSRTNQFPREEVRRITIAIVFILYILFAVLQYEPQHFRGVLATGQG